MGGMNPCDNVDGLCLDFGAGGHLYATHGLHAFAARCPPPLARWAIERYSKQDAVVLDPMCGSGTTLVEAALCGRTAQGADIDPLARLISAAKATLIDPWRIATTADELEERLRDTALDTDWRPSLPNFEKWFRADVASSLARIRAAIGATDADGGLRRLLWTVFSSLIVARTSVANARDLVHSRHHFRAWDDAPDVCGRFVAQVRRAARLMGDYRRRLHAAGHEPTAPDICGTDARNLPIESASVDLVFTSPPYCSALDYPRAHVFAVAWMADILNTDLDAYRALGRHYIGTERAALAEATLERPLPPPTGHEPVDRVVAALHGHPKRAWVVHRYFRDMAAVLAESARVLRAGSHAVFVVCPSNIRKVRIPTHEIFDALAPAVSGGALERVVLHERTIHDRRRVMPYLEASFGERMRTEYVLVFRRSG